MVRSYIPEVCLVVQLVKRLRDGSHPSDRVGPLNHGGGNASACLDSIEADGLRRRRLWPTEGFAGSSSNMHFCCRIVINSDAWRVMDDAGGVLMMRALLISSGVVSPGVSERGFGDDKSPQRARLCMAADGD